MQNLAEFLGKLSVMNWVQKRYDRDVAIIMGAENLWISLCATVKDCVETFNEHYGGNRPVNCSPAPKMLRLSRISTSVDPALRPPSQATIDLTFSETVVNVVQTIPLPDLIPNLSGKDWKFAVDLRQSGELCFNCDGRRMSADQVSQEILEGWLFGS
jgi:hypothetical protein